MMQDLRRDVAALGLVLVLLIVVVGALVLAFADKELPTVLSDTIAGPAVGALAALTLKDRAHQNGGDE